MFTITELSVAYGRDPVLRNLSFEAHSGSVTGIVGYNGAGKTTLLDAIYGLVPAPREAFVFDGGILNRKQVAYLRSQNFFYSRITGREYLELFRQKNSGFDVERWREIFRLPLDELVEGYSDGMKKKLALSGVLALDRELVMLDEPFNGLDLESVAVLQIVLRRLAGKGRTVIVTSHIIESLTPVCEAIALLRGGRMEKIYSPGEFDSLTENLRAEFDRKYGAAIEAAL
jgi:ABC-2 type transport system ATP-binding protein